MNRRDSMKLMIAATGGILLPAVEFARAQPMWDQEPDSPGSEFTPRPEAYALKPVFTRLRMGDVTPDGWIKEQMRRDLNVGFAGRLNELCHEASTDIFASGRNSPKHLATITRTGAEQPTDASSGFAWWNGETEGNWRAGFVMLAYLSGDETYKRKADAWVQHVLSYQGDDGYLGIYTPELRYKHDGEWWTQACLLRGLLAYAELTKNASVLAAVRRAIDNTISVFGEGKATPPWLLEPKRGFMTHDLMLSDVLERLFELTGEVRYRDFALWVYDNWSKDNGRSSLEDVDDALGSLLDRKRPFVGHGVDTLEGMRLPLWLWMATGREDLGQASRNALDKLERYSMPGGSVVSSEMISDQAPDPNMAEFEYCVTKETEFTYESALQKMGLAAHAERVERIFFNDAQGSRLPDGSAITYLTADNRLRLDGRTPDGSKPEPANKFSPTHADVAVCCNPMATQVAPLYVHGMWMRHRDGGLAALLYGPCTVATAIDGIRVELQEKTNYPFAQTVEVIVSPERTRSFPLYFRDPQWSRGTKLVCAGARIERDGDFWKVSKQWSMGDRISLSFAAEVQQVAAVNGDVTLQYGALLYALPVPHKQTVIKKYSVAGFEDTHYEPLNGAPDEFAFASEARWKGFGFKPTVKREEIATLHPFDEAILGLRGEMVNKTTGTKTSVELVPLGNAPVLRRLTFPIAP